MQRLDRPLELDADEDARRRTRERVSAARVEARHWLTGRRVQVDLGARQSDPATWELLSSFLEERGLVEIEHAFAERYVSNPGAGELVKGHRIVLAELGLAPYYGKIVRDPDLFAGAWSRERRAEHVVARLALVSELFRAAGHARVTLWRGMSSERPLEPLPPQTLVSATFSREVAEPLRRERQGGGLSPLPPGSWRRTALHDLRRDRGDERPLPGSRGGSTRRPARTNLTEALLRHRLETLQPRDREEERYDTPVGPALEASELARLAESGLDPEHVRLVGRRERRLPGRHVRDRARSACRRATRRAMTVPKCGRRGRGRGRPATPRAAASGTSIVGAASRTASRAIAPSSQRELGRVARSR